jgi:two-component system phosphate regulon sensor histidine kinase PhoR
MLRRWILLYGLAVLIATMGFGVALFDGALSYRVVLMAVLLTGAMLAQVWWIERTCARQLRKVTEATKRIAGGQYTQRINSAGGRAFDSLARAFNDMSESLAGQFAQFEEDRRQLRTILGGMIEGVVAIDGQQQLLFANQRAADLLEFHPITAIGRKFWEIIRQKPIQALLEKALDDDAPQREELDWRGGSKSMAIYVSPLGRERGAILVLQDISELRRLERLRQEFVANVSHELKTPLAVIKANVETLIDGAVDDREHRLDFLQQVNEQADRLHNLILDLMSLARIESGHQRLEIQRVALAEVVEDCVERHRPRIDAKAQTVVVTAPEEPSAAEIWTDPEALAQILDNLIDNAVKYTGNGSEIRIHWYGYGDRVCLEVADNGPGIPESDLPRIFERFYRVDKARSRELGGTGLGLAIVKHLAQTLKGNVKAESKLGHGTAFTVFLPRAYL